GVPPCRERAARMDLWAVWHSRALELARLEETSEEHFEPALDLGQSIGFALGHGDVWWPGALPRIAPRVPGEKGDLARAHTVAGDVKQVEVLQRIGSDEILGKLRGCIVVVAG